MRDSFRVVDAVAASDVANKETWIDEARFGYHYVRRYAGVLEPGARVLEVGCGSGILLAMIAERFPELELQGIEPFADGFSSLVELNELVTGLGAKIQAVGYEDFDTASTYELIYLVNVFEHLDDWRKFLGFVEARLAADGVCLVLCPNYDVPYESHFALPILGGKALTGRVFRRRIAAFEEKNDAHGLWDSLNFVGLSEVKKFVPATGLALTIRHGITADMIRRLSTDDGFRERQRVVGFLGRALERLGVVRLLQTRWFENLQPYMMLEFRHAGEGRV